MKEDDLLRRNSKLRVIIIDYLNEALGTKFKPHAARNQIHIDARLNEGYELQDFKDVIDYKVKDWGNSVKMAKFLVPQTIFSLKMETYVNQAIIDKREKIKKVDPLEEFFNKVDAEWEASPDRARWEND